MLKPDPLFLPLERSRAFASALSEWFRANALPHPWRKTRDPYAVLVSEVMLQQTTVQAVLNKGYYERFLSAFPDWEALAEADEESVLSAWEGLGYYSRARNLQKTARAVVEVFGGVFPEAHEDILRLPGIGPYTAGAVASFAFGQSRPVVDGNVARVLSRVMDFQTEVDSSAGLRQLWQWAAELVPAEDAGNFNAGLMELGQTVCTKTRPDCMACPIAEFCKCSDPEQLPRKKQRAKMTELDEFCLFHRDEGGALLMQREDGSRRKGMWRLPELPPQATAEADLITRYVITRYKVTLHTYIDKRAGADTGCEFIPAKSLPDLPVSAPYRKVIDELLQK